MKRRKEKRREKGFYYYIPEPYSEFKSKCSTKERTKTGEPAE